MDRALRPEGCDAERTVGSQDVDPQTRVVYVDNDPVVLVTPRTASWAVPRVREFLDLDQPVGLLFLAILHHLEDGEDPGGIVARLRGALAPGSYLAIPPSGPQTTDHTFVGGVARKPG